MLVMGLSFLFLLESISLAETIRIKNKIKRDEVMAIGIA